MVLFCCQEEEPIERISESWKSIILGEYKGGLEIFCGEDSFYMEHIRLTIQRKDGCYLLVLDSEVKLSINCFTLNILSIENNVDKNDVIHIDINKNPNYRAREVGAYKNVIYINDVFYNEVEGPNSEIRLSLISLTQDHIRHIFIRAKKYL